MFEAARRVTGLVLEVQFDARQAGQFQRDQMGVGAALKIRFDNADRFTGPVTVIAHYQVLFESNMFKGTPTRCTLSHRVNEVAAG
jgi:hypothetical protein